MNEWLRSLKKSHSEPFPERAVIEWPRCGRIRPSNFRRADDIGRLAEAFWRICWIDVHSC
ncbi:hypothetical protein BOS5A_210886 [Bosea sp. EC-HK365B]|nr:hypothetical protein BOSE7B_120746 [Bosea sp. 7B]CAD5274464.1 hypothetical protein BOSE21B_30167 [Bosea sp. 21B]VVT60095.1 hypothetical protein BOS5A_210886 [Bosea sp. EC-HK365B]